MWFVGLRPLSPWGLIFLEGPNSQALVERILHTFGLFPLSPQLVVKKNDKRTSFKFYDICDIKVEVMKNYDKIWKLMTIYKFMIQWEACNFMLIEQNSMLEKF